MEQNWEVNMYIGYYKSKIGLLEIRANDKGITNIDVVNEVKKERLNELVVNCIKELDEYFNLKRKVFTVPLVLEGTTFQVRVWEELLRIDFGKVASYLEVAKRIGNEKGVRAVANAIGKNKILVIIPCHRVIGSNQTLTGFRAGINNKKVLLESEGIKINK